MAPTMLLARVVERETSAEDIHAADASADHRIVRLSEIWTAVPPISDHRRRPGCCAAVRRAMPPAAPRIQIGRRQRQPWQTERIRGVGLLRGNHAAARPLIAAIVPGERDGTHPVAVDDARPHVEAEPPFGCPLRRDQGVAQIAMEGSPLHASDSLRRPRHPCRQHSSKAKPIVTDCSIDMLTPPSNTGVPSKCGAAYHTATTGASPVHNYRDNKSTSVGRPKNSAQPIASLSCLKSSIRGIAPASSSARTVSGWFRAPPCAAALRRRQNASTSHSGRRRSRPATDSEDVTAFGHQMQDPVAGDGVGPGARSPPPPDNRPPQVR